MKVRIGKMLVVSVATLLVTCGVAFATEVTWSVMHPTELDPAYMARVVEKSVEYGGVDSFEVCGTCHSGMGGMDGLLLFEPYRNTFDKRDKAKVEKLRTALKGVVREAHKAGKKLYYWHREGFLPEGILDDLPSLRDENGEIDLMGEAFYSYLRWRIAAAFEAVPEVDGYVLTLTEADFSVIHNSNAEKYPPVKVVERIARVFAEEHEKRGKRFTIRSFGSVAKDYEDIIAGASAAAKDHRFEIETKATPYDFSPFLSDNPFLRKVPGTTLGIECDGIGEFLGAGYPPCAQVDQIMRYVQAGCNANADRFVIRIDRIGNSIFDSAQEINLYTYMRLIRGNADLTREEIIDEWAAKRWKGCEKEMSALVGKSFEMVSSMEFVNGNVTFHQHPVAPSFKFLKAGGVFSALRDGSDLHMAKRLWGMQDGKRTPGRKRILAEKDRAVSLAQEGLATIEGLKRRLSPEEFKRQHRAWSCACKATVATREFFRCACAYFDDMEMGRRDPVTLKDCQAVAERCISAMMNNPAAGVGGLNVKHSEAVGADLDRVYFIPLRWLCREFLNEYAAERRVRAELEARNEVADFVVPGGIYDDGRVDRPMHGSYPEIVEGKPVRWVGNTIFPNGTIIVEFDVREGDAVEVALASGGSDAIRLSENGGPARSFKATEGVVRHLLESRGKTRVEIAKDGKGHPGVVSIALVRGKGRD